LFYWYWWNLWLSLFIKFLFISINEKHWFAESMFYIIYENVMWIQWPTIPVWWQKKRYCSDMSAIDGTSHGIQIPSNEPQQKTNVHLNNNNKKKQRLVKNLEIVNFLFHVKEYSQNSYCWKFAALSWHYGFLHLTNYAHDWIALA
jgi:hypothetical protein